MENLFRAQPGATAQRFEKRAGRLAKAHFEANHDMVAQRAQAGQLFQERQETRIEIGRQAYLIAAPCRVVKSVSAPGSQRQELGRAKWL